MANALKCDRCGKLYEIYRGVTFDGHDYRCIEIHGMLMAKSFDLCPDCMTKLIDFLKAQEDDIIDTKVNPCADCKHDTKDANDEPCIRCTRIHAKGDKDCFEYAY